MLNKKSKVKFNVLLRANTFLYQQTIAKEKILLETIDIFITSVIFDVQALAMRQERMSATKPDIKYCACICKKSFHSIHVLFLGLFPRICLY